MSTAMGPLRRVAVAVWSVGLVVLLFVPIMRDPPKDGFPLSNYPMFSHAKERQNARIVHVVGYSREGRHRPIPPDVLGTEEVMQAWQIVQIAIRRGQASDLCRRTAERVAADAGHRDIERLEVRTDHYDAIGYFAGQTKPGNTRVHAGCMVPGDAEAGG